MSNSDKTGNARFIGSRITGGDGKPKMKLRDIQGWPGRPGGAVNRPHKAPTNEQAMLKEVLPWRGSQVTFKCEFEGKPHSYDLKVTDASLAARIEKELRENIGRSVTEIGELEVPRAA